MPKIVNYFKTVAREISDIPQAVENMNALEYQNDSVKNLKRQVVEVAKAVGQNKKGTTSDKAVPTETSYWTDSKGNKNTIRSGGYAKGAKRK